MSFSSDSIHNSHRNNHFENPPSTGVLPAGTTFTQQPAALASPSNTPAPPSNVAAPATSDVKHPLYVEVALPYPEARKRAIAEFERVYVKALLERSGGNVSRGAREAQMDRVYLHRLIRKQKQRARDEEK